MKRADELRAALELFLPDLGGFAADPDGIVAVRRAGLPDGVEAMVYVLTFGRGRVVIGPVGEAWYDDGW